MMMTAALVVIVAVVRAEREREGEREWDSGIWWRPHLEGGDDGESGVGQLLQQ